MRSSEAYIWPSFFIVGGVKCGTTTLYSLLKKHPQVFLPELKEPHFFADITPPPEARDILCSGDPVKYQRLYRGAGSFPAIGDASPSYLWDESSPGRIYEVSPKAKIIVMLRDPIARAHSHYLMNVLHGHEKLPFIQALRLDHAQPNKKFWRDRLLVDLGLYYKQVRRYFDTFGRDQVLVLLFDDLQRNPRELLSAVTQHIGVDPARLDESETSRSRNSYKAPKFQAAYRLATGPVAKKMWRTILPESVREWLKSTPLLYGGEKPALDEEARRFLQDIYDPDVTLLEELLDRKLPELRKSWA
jgi:hypothetical protein